MKKLYKTKDILERKYSRSNLEKKWKLVIKQRAGYKCELCPNSRENGNQMHAHHIEGKQSYYSLTLLDNGLCVCGGCHMDLHATNGLTRQKEKLEALTRLKGKKFLEDLSIKVKNPPKFSDADKEAVYVSLCEILQTNSCISA